MHEREHSATGLGKSAFITRPAHRLANSWCRELRDHARSLGRGQRGAMSQNARIDHQQLVIRARLAPEHDPAEAYLGIDRENDLGELGLADAAVKCGAQFRELSVCWPFDWS
jgi:hypothetical protein